MTGGTVGSKLRDTGHASSDHDLVIRTASEIHAAHWQMSGDESRCRRSRQRTRMPWWLRRSIYWPVGTPASAHLPESLAPPVIVRGREKRWRWRLSRMHFS